MVLAACMTIAVDRRRQIRTMPITKIWATRATKPVVAVSTMRIFFPLLGVGVVSLPARKWAGRDIYSTEKVDITDAEIAPIG
jgi:hypothetical protein